MSREISEWQNCPGIPTVKTRSKIQVTKNPSKIKVTKNPSKIKVTKNPSKIIVVKNPSKIKVTKSPSKIWESKNCPGTPTPILLEYKPSLTGTEKLQIVSLSEY